VRASSTYEDFALRIEQVADGRLAARVLRSPYGACAPVPFEPPLPGCSPSEILRSLEGAVLAEGASAEPARQLAPVAGGPRRFTPEQVGQALFESLFADAVRQNLLSSLALLEGRGQAGLRLRLIVAPELADAVGVWPWELLYRFETRDFLGRSIRTPIVRQLEVQRPALTPTPIRTLRILVVLSDPSDVPGLKVEREKELIETALGGASGIDLRFLEPPTIEALRRSVRGAPFDALHFVGHGALDSLGHGRVSFEREDGSAHPVSGTVLADTLKTFDQTVRFVFLNACQTAVMPRDAAGHDPYRGAASALVMAGVPAVVAMQFPITDRAALAFSAAFYRALAAGDPVEGAVAEGRMAILHDRQESWEWATPVLFLGVPHGQLFEVAGEGGGAGERQQRSVTPAAVPETATLAAGLELFEKLRYERAAAEFDRVRSSRPDDPAAYYYLALARLQGTRPRSARLDVVRKIESDLETALDLAQSATPAHVYFLQALIKHDFYRLKGLVIRPPSVEELLVEAQASPADPVELERLLNHVPTPPNPVRAAIEARRLAGE
jgi:hypothetical protein